MKKLDRKDKVIMILTIIILILVIGLILVISMKSLSSINTNENNVTEENKKETKTVTESLTTEDQTILLEKIKLYDNYFITFEGNKLPQDMTDTEKFTFYLKNNYEKFQDGVSSGEILNYLKESFGSATTFTPIDNYLCPVDNLPLIIYDKEKDLYKVDYSEHGHDGDYISKIFSFYVDGTKTTKDNKTTYKIRVRKAFSNYITIGIFSSYYGNYTDAKNGKNEVFDIYKIYGNENLSDEELSTKVKTQYEKYKGMFSIYTYVFETNSDIENSYLISLTK
ncbi:MAG: hypothetical protein PUB03_06175 [bacterium]|nr:hypothetical protein [bacterium]